MSLEATVRQVLAAYHAHVCKWRRCYSAAFPHLRDDFGIDDVSDADIELYDELRDDESYEAEQLLKVLIFRIETELALPDTDPAKESDHNE